MDTIKEEVKTLEQPKTQPKAEPKRVLKTLKVLAVGVADTMPKEIYQGDATRFSSCLLLNGKVARGIAIKDEKKIPEFARSLMLDTTAHEWNSEVEKYWINWETKVPFGEIINGTIIGGQDLNASYTIEVDGTIVPDVLKDYIFYNLLLQGTKVSFDPIDWMYKDNFEFFCIDLTKEEEKKDKETGLRTEVFITVAKWLAAKDEEKIKFMLCQLLPEISASEIMEYPELKWQGALQKIAMEQPEKLLQVSNLPNLPELAKIRQYLGAGIISEVNGSYYYGNENIGSSEKHVIAYLKNPANAGTIGNWDLELDERQLLNALA